MQLAREKKDLLIWKMLDDMRNIVKHSFIAMTSKEVSVIVEQSVQHIEASIRDYP